MKHLLFAVALATGWLACAADVQTLGEWEFRRGGEEAWRTVRVPHDWGAAGPFDPDGTSVSDEGFRTSYSFSGKLPWYGWGDYRCTVAVDDAAAKTLADGGRAYLEFDGVMHDPKVKVNGHDAGGWDFGFQSFALDVTKFVRPGKNLVEVHADTRNFKGRWHIGGGIYREARFAVRPREHVLPGTLAITTPSVTKERAEVVVRYETPSGRREKRFTVERPRLWDVDDPFLYEVELHGERFRYGIRTFEWTVDDGFHLNGRRVQVKGANRHSDFGPLGAAFSLDAAKRQLNLFKDMGVNAIRTSHNIPAPQLLELCDEMGFIVWDECFDKWDALAGRRADQNLEEYMERNLRQFVRRDRNHPCVFAWSIGNEIKPVDMEEAGMSRERVKRFRDAIRQEDATRPVAAGVVNPEFNDKDILDDLDLVGWNYSRSYSLYREKHPGQPVVYTESASALSSSGYFGERPAAFRLDYAVATREVDGYDHCSAPWSDIPDYEFERMAQDRYCAGEFVWTALDYLGEPTPYARHDAKFVPLLKGVPERELARSSHFGAIDLCGIPKDRFYLYRSQWNGRSETVHVLPHWNWPSRSRPAVFVYTSGDSAELFLNGRSLGRRSKAAGKFDASFDKDNSVYGDRREYGDWRTNAYYGITRKYRLVWDEVAYEPGELKAVAYRGGRRIGEDVVRTAGEPVAVKLEDDPYNDAGALVRFVRVSVVDKNGVRDPLSAKDISFSLEGDGEVLAVGNGDARSYKSFAEVSHHPLYYGNAEAVVRVVPGRTAVLKASAPGLEGARLALRGSTFTAELQGRIDDAWRRGGGEVVVGAGTHELGAVRLRSGITLRLKAGAKILASTNAEDYAGTLLRDKVEPVTRETLEHGFGEDITRRSQNALFHALLAHDVTVVGEPGSSIDGRNCFDALGAEGYRGPHVFSFVACTNVEFRGVAVENAGDYAYKFVDSRNVVLDGAKAVAGHDGVHFDLCQDVSILNGTFLTGDDSVAGSGCSGIVVSNCTLSSACSAVRLGGRDVLMTDCRIVESVYPHRWTLTREEKMRGANPSEVAGRRRSGGFYQGYTGDSAHKNFRPGNILVRNTTVEGCGRFLLSVSGLPGALWQDGHGIADITFENVSAKGLSFPSVVSASADEPMKLVFRNCSFAFDRPQEHALLVDNVEVVEENVKLENAGRFLLRRSDIGYDDVPEFPSWRVETDDQRAKWGLPPLKAAEIEVREGGETPAGALRRIRASRRSGDTRRWTVRVAGFNALRDPLVFTSEDHGIDFVGKDNACISGGGKVGGWVDTGKGWWEAPAPCRKDGSVIFFEQLWTNGRRAGRSRYPKDGWLRIAEPALETNRVDGTLSYRESFVLTNAADRAVLATMRPGDLEYASLGLVNIWAFSRRIVRGYDKETGRLSFTSPQDWSSWWLAWSEKSSIVAFENVRGAFTDPGDWFYDVAAKKLLYRPIPGETIAGFEAIAPVAKMSSVVRFDGDYANGRFVGDIAFRDISFAHSAATKPWKVSYSNDLKPGDYGEGPTETWAYQAAVNYDAMIFANGVRNLEFDSCWLGHTGNWAIRFGSGCMSNRVVNCDFSDLGAGGVWMGSRLDCRGNGSKIERKILYPDRPDSTAFNLVSNCTVSAAGLFNPEATGIIIGHCSDTKVVHNDIHDIYYTGISCGFVWGYAGSVAQRNEIAYNLVYDLGKGTMDDMAGIYTLGASYGTRVHHNVVHDVRCFGVGGHGLYTDEGTEGVVMEDNIVWNTTNGAFHQHYGVENYIRNNVFGQNDGYESVWLGAVERKGVACSVHFCNNIVFTDKGRLVSEPPGVGVAGVRAHNVWYSPEGVDAKMFNYRLSWNDWLRRGREIGSVFADPLFVDAAKHDYRLRPESPALKLGFKPIDVSTVGPVR